MRRNTEANRVLLARASQKTSPRENAGLKSWNSACLAAVLANRQPLSLEGELVVYRCTRRRSEVRQSDQVLKVIGEPAEGVGETAEVGIILQGIAIFESATRRADYVIDEQRIVHPFAEYIRQSGDVLGKVAWVIDV